MTEILQLAVLGLGLGAAYALLSVGMVATYKGSGVLNLGHGAIGMIGTFVYGIWVIDGHNKWLGLLIGIAVSGLIGAIVQFVLIRRLQRASVLSQTVATFGVLLFLTGFAELYWGDDTRIVPPLLPTSVIQVGKVVVPVSGLLALGVALALTLSCWAFFRFTTIGLATEASSISDVSARRLGYPVQRLALLNWTAGSAAAGLAGILIVDQIGLTQQALTLLVLQAMAAALVGAFRSLGLTFITAVLIGVSESVLVGKLNTGWQQALPFFLIVIVLLIRGEVLPSRGRIAISRLPAAPFPKFRPIQTVLALVLAVVLPLLFTTYWKGTVVLAGGDALVALSLVLVTGYSGQISLMQWTFAGFGAFVGGDLLANQGWGVVPAIAAVIVAGLVAGALFGIPTLRVRGLSLAIVTLGGGLVINGLVLQDHWGSEGLNLPTTPDFFGHGLSQLQLAYLAMVLVGIAALGMWLFRRSRLGQRVVAARASERAATALGVNSAALRLAVFAAGGGLAALGGFVWALESSSIQPDSFTVLIGISILATVFILGLGTISAGVVAGIALAFVPAWITQQGWAGGDWFSCISGVAVMLGTVVHPDGAILLRHTLQRHRRHVQMHGSQPTLHILAEKPELNTTAAAAPEPAGAIGDGR
jgi:branched-subunit amino acid ABC-type transport system permease component